MLAAGFIGKMNNLTADYVLVSRIPLADPHIHHPDYQALMDKMKARSVFLSNLKAEGVKVKTVQLKDSGLLFDLLSAPQVVLERYPDIPSTGL